MTPGDGGGREQTHVLGKLGTELRRDITSPRHSCSPLQVPSFWNLLTLCMTMTPFPLFGENDGIKIWSRA